LLLVFCHNLPLFVASAFAFASSFAIATEDRTADKRILYVVYRMSYIVCRRLRKLKIK
jgi:hypothetical protein